MAVIRRGRRFASIDGEEGERRHRLLERRPGLAAVVLTFALIAQACTGAATPEEEGGDEGNADTTEVKNPGVFVHSLGGEPETLDPAAATDGGFGNRAIIQMYDFLVDLPPDSAVPIPMISTEVPTQENGLVSEDGLVYTFPIREGVLIAVRK